jgi:hypothetical protein
MEAWFADNWWWMWSLVAVTAYIAYRMHRRGKVEPLPRRALYVLVPLLDPANKEKLRRVYSVQLPIMAVGIVLILIALLLLEILSP